MSEEESGDEEGSGDHSMLEERGEAEVETRHEGNRRGDGTGRWNQG